MPWDIGGPSSGSSGSNFDKSAHEGHRILCVHAESKPDTATQYGTADAVLCRYVVCIDDDHVSVDAMLFGVALVPRIVEAAETGRKIVLGRLTRGTAKPGQSAAWLFEYPEDEDLALAEKWLDAHAVEMPSGRYEIDVHSLKPPPDDGSF